MLNWAAFGRRSLGKAKPSQLRWMFYNAKIAWELLLQASIKHILATATLPTKNPNKSSGFFVDQKNSY